MPRSIWSGAISFGLVNVPVKVYSAVSPKTVRFHQLNSKTGGRISQKRVDPQSGEEVPYEDLVKGYELTKDRYVVIKPEELEAIAPEKTRSIDIEDFVELDQIDPVYYDHPYWLAPDKGAAKAYGLLLEAMKESGKVAIARVVLRNKEHLVAVRPAGDALMMETMVFHDEVVSAENIDELVAATEAKTTAKAAKKAKVEPIPESGRIECRTLGHFPVLKMFDIIAGVRTLHISYNLSTKWFLDGVATKSSALRRDLDCIVTYRRDRAGRILATKVELFTGR